MANKNKKSISDEKNISVYQRGGAVRYERQLR